MSETIGGARVFNRVCPEENERRRYVIAWGPTLFGTQGVLLSWGRMGTNRSQQRVVAFDSADEALAEVEAQIERRLKRGYVEVPGPWQVGKTSSSGQ